MLCIFTGKIKNINSVLSFVIFGLVTGCLELKHQKHTWRHKLFLQYTLIFVYWF